ncbi:DUF2786 domain-containing protein [Actinomycetospora straminea]|uniref:DUF2786 domain-containing protein n=1 Tax=Actinomycetospora straminea TaxID=663607 RepID=A0ABP9ERZ5_9PSEU|nr:DUF2786 domain-containing protein [Actinomycetospora straminea]MDD7933919.1 DUF2786 domain-containing protein [Actinomycetospora straminea]
MGTADDPRGAARFVAGLAAAGGRGEDAVAVLRARYGTSRTLLAGAELALLDAADALHARGWGARDVTEVVRRRLPAARVVLAVDVLGAAAARRPRGEADLAELDAEPPARDVPLVGQWSSVRGLDPDDALAAAVSLVGLLRSLPTLPRLGEEERAPAGVDARVLARVRGLLAKAESTEYPEEAEALSAKAQELMGRHALEQALVAGPATSAPRAAARRLWLDAPYANAKSSLVHQVAAANRCRAVSLPSLDMVTVVGHAADLATVELLVTSLLVQADRAMLAAHDGSVPRSRTRSFRHAFLLAYATRIGERLTAAAHEAQAHARAELGEGLLPVLAARAEVVEQTVGELFPRLTRRRFSVGNGDGWAAGRAAADAASLTPGREALADRQG